MTDVRLTATNPEDSSVVPVACNSRGELLVTEPVINEIANDVTIDGELIADTVRVKTGDPEGVSSIGGDYFLVTREAGHPDDSFRVNPDGHVRLRKFVNNDLQGTAYISSDYDAFSIRSKNDEIVWTVDWNGHAHSSALIINTDASNPDSWNTVERDGESISTYTGPVLDVGAELVFLRSQVRALMERLKMTPEGGWPVWSGSD